jgi:hypothetical protein
VRCRAVVPVVVVIVLSCGRAILLLGVNYNKIGAKKKRCSHYKVQVPLSTGTQTVFSRGGILRCVFGIVRCVFGILRCVFGILRCVFGIVRNFAG